MNFSGFQQKNDVLYATERMAVLLFLCCGGKEGYRFLQFFLLQTSSIYLTSALTHKDTTLDEFPPILVGPVSYHARQIVSKIDSFIFASVLSYCKTDPFSFHQSRAMGLLLQLRSEAIVATKITNPRNRSPLCSCCQES